MKTRPNSSAFISKDKFLRSLTRNPQVEVPGLVERVLNKSSEFLLRSDVFRETLARARGSEFRFDRGYFTIQEIDVRADEVEVYFIICLIESPADPSAKDASLDGSSKGTTARISFLPFEHPGAASNSGRTLKAQAKILFQPKGEVSLGVSHATLSEGSGTSSQHIEEEQ